MAFLALITGCAGPDLKEATRARDEFVSSHGDRIHEVALDGKAVRVARAGDDASRRRPPLVFVHGSPGEWGGWAKYFSEPRLTERFDVVAFDRPGFGGTQPGVPEPSLAKQASVAMAAFADNGSGRPAILVGHSYGGPVVVRAAIDHPDRIGAVVVVAGAVSPALEETKWYQNVALWPVVRWLVPESLDVCNREILALKAELVAMQDQWGKLKAAVYLLHGEADPLVPVANVDFARERLGAARAVHVERVPGMNHFVPWEHPDKVLEAIDWAETH